MIAGTRSSNSSSSIHRSKVRRDERRMEPSDPMQKHKRLIILYKKERKKERKKEEDEDWRWLFVAGPRAKASNARRVNRFDVLLYTASAYEASKEIRFKNDRLRNKRGLIDNTPTGARAALDPFPAIARVAITTVRWLQPPVMA